MAKAKEKREVAEPVVDDSSAGTDQRFMRTVRKLLSTPPKPHADMKKGAAPKRDARSSDQGAKG